MDKVSRKVFRIVYELAKCQPWLNNKLEKLEQLLFDECSTEEQRELLIDLINRFEYLSSSRYVTCITDLSEEIATDPELNDTDTQVVAMAGDSEADSSQYILYDLKPLLEQLKWRKYKQVNTFGQAYKTYKRYSAHKNIVLIDEFVGSGKTVIGRVGAIKKVFEDNKVGDFNVKVKVIAAMEQGLIKIRSEGIEISALITLKKGISDCYPPPIVPEKISRMIEMESILSPSHDGTPLPSLGYGETESLYCRDNGNVPNSVFPVFWWPFYRDGTDRDVLLTRAMIDA